MTGSKTPNPHRGDHGGLRGEAAEIFYIKPDFGTYRSDLLTQEFSALPPRLLSALCGVDFMDFATTKAVDHAA